MAPFISLNTIPLKIIGDSGLDRSSGSNRQPSCLVQEIYLFIIGKYCKPKQICALIDTRLCFYNSIETQTSTSCSHDGVSKENSHFNDQSKQVDFRTRTLGLCSFFCQ